MNEKIFDVLSGLGIDIAFEDYEGDDDTYIRFFHLPQVDFQAEDGETYATHYVQIDLFTKWDYTHLSKQIIELMIQARFKKNFEDQTYETDTKLFHKILRFYIIKEE